jgi:branched-chain amino acid transport system permease protein
MKSFKNIITQPKVLLVIFVIIGLAIMPIWLPPYRQNVVIISMYYVILAASWNLLAGYTGLFSLAHHTLAGLGGYASGLLIYHFNVSIGVGFVAAVLTAGIIGFLLGVLVLRMRGIYLAVATWAFAESVRLVMTAAYKYTRGEQGLYMPPLFDTLDPTNYYYLFLFLTIASLLLMYAVVRSPIGSFLRAIKDDELAASAMGVDTVKWKLFIMTFASSIAGIAGFFLAHYILILSPVILSFNEIGKIVIMTVFGGLGTFAGPIIGAPMVVVISEFTRDFGAWNMVIYSFIVILIMRINRQGIVGLIQNLWKRISNRQSGEKIQALEN